MKKKKLLKYLEIYVVAFDYEDKSLIILSDATSGLSIASLHLLGNLLQT